MRKSASRGSKIAPDFCISGRFLRLRACPALRAARFWRGSKASGGRAGAFGGERPRSSQGACPFAAVFRERRGEERENAARALEAVGWFPPGGLLPRVSRGTGGVRAEGPGGEGRARSPLGGCASALGDARSFCGAKSRSLMAAGMAGQEKGRALFLHAAFDGAFCVGYGRLALSGTFFAARFAEDGEAFVRRAPVGRDGRVCLWEDVPAPRGCPFLLRREESFVDGCGDGGPRERPRALSTRGF